MGAYGPWGTRRAGIGKIEWYGTGYGGRRVVGAWWREEKCADMKKDIVILYNENWRSPGSGHMETEAGGGHGGSGL